MNLLQAYKFLDMITEGKDSYLDDYKKYIIEHKGRVLEYADWLKENLPELFETIDIELFDEMIEEHDESKFSEEEFEAYAKKFYGKQDINGKPLEYIPGFEEAWKHHWTNNEHHPEFWLGEDMPYIYILEMICDWGSFGIENNDFGELISYYYDNAKDDEDKMLSDNTKIIIEEILDKIKSVLSKEVK